MPFGEITGTFYASHITQLRGGACLDQWAFWADLFWKPVRSVTFLLSNHSRAWRHRWYIFGCISPCVLIPQLEDNSDKKHGAAESGLLTKENQKMTVKRQKMKRQLSDACLPSAQRRNLLVFVEEYQNTWGISLDCRRNREGRRKYGYGGFRERLSANGHGEVRDRRRDGASAVDQADAHRAVGTAAVAGSSHLLHLYVRYERFSSSFFKALLQMRNSRNVFSAHKCDICFTLRQLWINSQKRLPLHYICFKNQRLRQSLSFSFTSVQSPW